MNQNDLCALLRNLATSESQDLDPQFLDLLHWFSSHRNVEVGLTSAQPIGLEKRLRCQCMRCNTKKGCNFKYFKCRFQIIDPLFESAL